MRPETSFERGLFVREYRESAASRTAPPLVWIHGLGESGLCFEGLLAEERWRDRRHLVPDLSGYGRAERTDAPLPLAGLADGVAAWLDHRGISHAVVVGHSMGGVVALLLAERYPGRVAAVIDVEGNKTIDDCVYSSAAEGVSPAEFAARGFDRLRAGVAAKARGDLASRTYGESLRLAEPRQFHANALELVELSRGGTLARRLAGLPVPQLYVGGVPRGAGPRTLEAVAGAGLPFVLIENAGHWPFLDRPDAFASALHEFLVRLDEEAMHHE